MQNGNANIYQETSIMTADPGKLIIMCYEKAIHHLSAAMCHYENKEYEAKAKNLQKAIDVITELNSCLDMKRGSDIAQNLDALYRYMVTQLIAADLQRNMEGFRQVIGMLKELDEAWREIILHKPQQAFVGKAQPSPFSPRPAALSAAGLGKTWSA